MRYSLQGSSSHLSGVCVCVCVCEGVVVVFPQKSSESGERQPQLVTCLNELARIYQQQVSGVC